jgi:hypothetical protein
LKISVNTDGSLQVKETLFDMIPSQELNLDTLKDAKDAKPSQDEIDEELEERRVELDTIAAFIANKKKQALLNPKQEVVEAPKKKVQKRGFSSGRPRKSFVKVVTFTKLDDGSFKLSGRGRPSPDQKRVKVSVHFSWTKTLTPNESYSKKELSKMTKPLS